MVGVVALAVVYLVSGGADSAMTSTDGNSGVRVKSTGATNAEDSSSQCRDRCAASTLTSKEVDELEAKLLAGREEYLQDLRSKYGEYLDKVFLNDSSKSASTSPTSRGYESLLSAMSLDDPERQPSRDRMQRKIAMKVLEAARSSSAGCSCADSNDQSQSNGPKTTTTFVWSVGGHSAAAGHGNLLNETYAAFLEQGAAPVLEKVGIRFISRNYAMGGMISAPEIAMCSEAIFGMDTDVISWDYALTDSGE